MVVFNEKELEKITDLMDKSINFHDLKEKAMELLPLAFSSKVLKMQINAFPRQDAGVEIWLEAKFMEHLISSYTEKQWKAQGYTIIKEEDVPANNELTKIELRYEHFISFYSYLKKDNSK